MSDEMQIDGKSYISSKRAAVLSTHAQDYIGQLARKSLIDARRVGGLWYVSMESLEAYKKKAEEYKPVPPGRPEIAPEPEALVFFDGKEYLSAAKAAQQTGYTQDYVGQLSRAGTILSRQVGNRWYVQRESIIDHKKEKDALLAEVQSQSVGLAKRVSEKISNSEYQANHRHSGHESLLTYHSENQDLIPTMMRPETVKEQEEESAVPIDTTKVVAIRKIQTPIPRISTMNRTVPAVYRSNLPVKRSPMPLMVISAATIIIALSIGYASVLRQNSVYATNITHAAGVQSAVANANALANWIGDLLEPALTHQLIYERTGSN